MSEAVDPVRTMHRFRAAHEAEWVRLEDILRRAERRSVKVLSDDELFALPVLYRSTLSALSVARETSLDRALVEYLEGLATRAYMFVYGVRTPPLVRIAAFFRREWPAAVRALGIETLVAIAMMLAGAIAAWLLVRQDASWFYAIISPDLANGRDPAASTEALAHGLRDGGGASADMLAGFAASLFTHNAQISILAFALGFAFGVPTLLLLAYNGAMLGAFLAVYGPRGLALELGGWLAIHGTTELFAIALAGAAGLRIGRKVAFPGRLTRMAAATEAGRTAATAMVGVVLMLLVAGLLEGIGRQTVTALSLRWTIGGVALAGWLAYYYAPRRGRHDG